MDLCQRPGIFVTKWRQTAYMLAVIAGLGTGAASAQQRSPATIAPAPSQVAPPIFAPAPPKTPFVRPETPPRPTAPEGATTLSLFLVDIDVEGEFEDLVATRRELAAPLIGKRVTVAELYDFVNKLEQAYVRAGYIFARVVVLPQQLESRARVKLQVIDGFIERIDASALPPLVQERVSAVLAPLINSRHLMLAKLERALLIAGETPGLTLDSTLSAGKEVGGTVLILSGTYRPISAVVYVDDAMPQTFGTWQVVSSFAENNLFGIGEQISLQATGFPDRDFFTAFPTRRYLSATAVMPLGIDGWRFEVGGTDGRTTPRVDQSVASQGLPTQGHVQLAYDVVKNRDYATTFAARFEANDERLNLLAFTPPIPLYLDRVRPLRGSLDGVWRLRDSGTVFIYGATVSQGLNGFGARLAADANPLLPLSRAGADAVFTKVSAHIEVSQTLPQDFFVTLMAFGQTSFHKPLLNSEQFDITGAKMLSGVTAGALSGDTAWAVRSELGRPFAIPVQKWGTTLTPYLFAATGERILENPSVLEIGSVHASNLGGGMRVNLASVPADMLPNSYGFIEYSRRYITALDLSGWRIFGGWVLSY